jgi:hypothetical protein
MRRGVAIDTCSAAGLPIYEYEPLRVKQAVLGHGNATKAQIQRMVATTLGLPKIPPEDAADAWPSPSPISTTGTGLPWAWTSALGNSGGISDTMKPSPPELRANDKVFRVVDA